MTKQEFEEHKKYRTESLERLIPEMQKCRGRHFTRRMIIALVVVFVIMVYILHRTLLASAPLGMLLLLSLVSTFGLILISYIISSFTFSNACHEALVIEKMITEHTVLTKGYDDSMDMTLEIGKLRDFL